MATPKLLRSRRPQLLSLEKIEAYVNRQGLKNRRAKATFVCIACSAVRINEQRPLGPGRFTFPSISLTHVRFWLTLGPFPGHIGYDCFDRVAVSID